MNHLLVVLTAAILAVPADAQTGQPVQVGDFWLQLHVDPMTDEARGNLMVNAAESTTFQPVVFGWTCTASGLEAAFTHGRALGRDGAVVQVRFDQDRPGEPVAWAPGRHPSFVFVPGEATEVFTRRAMAANRMVLRVWDSREQEHTYVFSMQGLTRGLRRLPCTAWLFGEG